MARVWVDSKQRTLGRYDSDMAAAQVLNSFLRLAVGLSQHHCILLSQRWCALLKWDNSVHQEVRSRISSRCSAVIRVM